MKKVILILTTIYICLTLVSCKIENKYINYADGYDVTVGEELKPYLLYPEQIPTLHFDMKNLHVSTSSNNYQLILVNNNYENISDAWSKHISVYDGQYVILENAPQTRESKNAKFGDTNKKLDEFDEFGKKQEYSREIRMVCWTNDGTRYSYQYRTFVSGGKRYYSFCYSTPLTMALEQSMMVVKVDNSNKLVLVPLPFDTKYEVSGSNLTVDALINKNTYLDEKYNCYVYPNSLTSLSKEEKVEKVKAWYQTFCNGRMENDIFVIDYSGSKFKVSFNETKEDSNGKKQDAFKLTYISKG